MFLYDKDLINDSMVGIIAYALLFNNFNSGC